MIYLQLFLEFFKGHFYSPFSQHHAGDVGADSVGCGAVKFWVSSPRLQWSLSVGLACITFTTLIWCRHHPHCVDDKTEA